MAKHCTNCGHALRETTDKFCAQCGTQVGDTQVQPPQYWQFETCQIEYALLRKSGNWSKSQLQFVADAVGPKGRYIAGESAPFAGGRDHNRILMDFPSAKLDHHIAALNDLIRKVTAEGWESLGRTGEYWYSYKFRRVVK